MIVRMVQDSHTIVLGCRDELSEWRCRMTFTHDWELTGTAGTGIFWGNNQPHLCEFLRHQTKRQPETGKALRPDIFLVMILLNRRSHEEVSEGLIGNLNSVIKHP